MAEIISFDEYVLQLYDTNGNGKIDRDGRGEYTAWKRALNKRNIANTRQGYAEYVALMERTNQNQRAAENQQALINAASQGNEAAATMLTGESKSATASKIILIVSAAAVLLVLLLKRK